MENAIDSFGRDNAIHVRVDQTVISIEAASKACYWFGRDFEYQIQTTSDSLIEVTLIPKANTSSRIQVKADFLALASDFALRERVDAQTKGLRELLLAKAFAEAGVLEDSPEGVFGDRIEEENPNGEFKILSNH